MGAPARGGRRPEYSDFCRAYGWAEVERVIDEVNVLVRHAHDEYADQGPAKSADHFERLLLWLTQHDDELKARPGTIPSYQAPQPGFKHTLSLTTPHPE